MELTSNTMSDVERCRYIHINKTEFFDMLDKLNTDNSVLLENFKSNFSNIKLIFNGKNIEKYMVFINKIVELYENYLKRLLLLTSESCYIQILNILKKQIDDDYHIVFNEEKKNIIQITLHHLCKQISINISFKIFKLNSLSKIHSERNLDIIFIADLINMEPIVFVVKDL